MVEMHHTTLAKIEKGERPIRAVEAATMADLFGVSLDALLGRRVGLANELADMVTQLQQAASRGVSDIGALAGQLQSLYRDLGDIEFDSREELHAHGNKAGRALEEAMNALYAIAQVPAPKQVHTSKLEDMIERKAQEKANAIFASFAAQLKESVKGDQP